MIMKTYGIHERWGMALKIEFVSWYYPETKTLAIYSQEGDILYKIPIY